MRQYNVTWNSELTYHSYTKSHISIYHINGCLQLQTFQGCFFPPTYFENTGWNTLIIMTPHDWLLNRLSRHRSKETSKFRVTGFVGGINREPENSSHKGPVTREMFPFDNVIILYVFSNYNLLQGYVMLCDLLSFWWLGCWWPCSLYICPCFGKSILSNLVRNLDRLDILKSFLSC